jgi:hypothetical protein
MAEYACPKCHAALTDQEVKDGWCEACGKQLPVSLRPAASPETAGGAPARPWSGRIVLFLALALVGALLVIALVTDGVRGFWRWLQAMMGLLLCLSAAGVAVGYCDRYPDWAPTYRVLAVIAVVFGVAFAVIVYGWGPLRE